MNIGQMMRQVQDMQNKMTQMQDRLAEIEVTGQSGGGMVTASMSGKGDLRKVKLDSKLIDPAEVEVLEDLVVAAVNDAKAKLDAHLASETEKMMGGMKLPPGFKMPF
ncbi:MAG: YbaB/EbfC family nucleoid-associated protein [Alphaproteobacteria bacterium]|nr:YbaB/EbfC family nucleoid-associated protein [Alphaproteobacteria bacterium]